jgi:hypothetical protein
MKTSTLNYIIAVASLVMGVFSEPFNFVFIAMFVTFVIRGTILEVNNK